MTYLNSRGDRNKIDNTVSLIKQLLIEVEFIKLKKQMQFMIFEVQYIYLTHSSFIESNEADFFFSIL